MEVGEKKHRLPTFLALFNSLAKAFRLLTRPGCLLGKLKNVGIQIDPHVALMRAGCRD